MYQTKFEVCVFVWMHAHAYMCVCACVWALPKHNLLQISITSQSCSQAVQSYRS